MPGPRTEADHVRHHRARKEIHTERDRLLSRASRLKEIQRFLPDDTKDRVRAALTALELTMFAMVSYITMICMWFYLYHFSFTIPVVVFVVLVALGGMLMIMARSRQLGWRHPWVIWYAGSLFIAGTFIGLVVAFYLYVHHLAYYWRLKEMRTYTNVAAAQSAGEFSDGGVFLWTEDTRIDVMRSVGYKSRWTGHTYCVAPLVDNSMTNADDLNYWVIGMDCCESRAAFHCNNAGDATVKTAMAVLEPQDIARPFMLWAVPGSVSPMYKSAIRLQQATYYTRAAAHPKLLVWAKDPIRMRNQFYSTATITCIWISIILFVVLFSIASYFSWTCTQQELKETLNRWETGVFVEEIVEGIKKRHDWQEHVT